MVTTLNLPANVPPPWQLHKTATTPKPVCPTCHGSKIVLDPKQQDSNYPLGKPIPCPACNAAAPTGFAHDLTKLTATERRYSFDSLIVDATNREPIALLKRLLATPKPTGFVYIYGELGAGKSRLLITALNQARTQGHTVVYGNAAATGDHIKDAIRVNDDVRGRLRALCAIPVLGIDDWDRQSSNEFTQMLMMELFDTRFRMSDEALTIIGGNTAPAMLLPYYADRLEQKNKATVIALAPTSWRVSPDWNKE